MRHTGVTKDKSRRQFRWDALFPGFIQYMGRENVSVKELAQRVGIGIEPMHKHHAKATAPSWPSLKKLEEFYESEIGELPYEQRCATA
jgi:hypothetical protein